MNPLPEPGRAVLDHPFSDAAPALFRAVPAPLPFEPAHGWVRRAAHANGQVSMRGLVAQFGIEYDRLDPATCLALAKASDVARFTELVASTPVITGTRVATQGLEVSTRNWSVATRRYCPGCLSEDGYHRFFWDYRFFLSCPFHGLELAGDKEPDRVYWTCTDMLSAENGQRLPVETDRLPSALPSLERYSLGRCGVVDACPAQLLDGEPFDDVVWAVGTLGIMLAGLDRNLLAKKKLPITVESQSMGFMALSGSPLDLKAALSAHAEAALNELAPRTRIGIGKLFGRAYYAAVAMRRSPIASTLTATMWDVATETGRVVPSRKRPPAAEAKVELLTLEELAAQLSLTRIKARILCKLVGLPGGDTPGERFLYSHDDASMIRRIFEEGYTPEATSQALGVSARDLPILEKSGLLRCVYLKSRERRDGKIHYAPDVKAILDRFGDLPAPDVPTVSLRSFAFACGISRGELMRRIVAGEVLPAGRIGRGRCFNGMRIQTEQAARSPGITARRAAFLLGLPTKMVRSMCLGGLLPSDGGTLRFGGIPEGAVETLRRDYVSTAMVTPRMGGLKGWKAIAELKRLGIRVIRIKRAPTALASRSDLLRKAPWLLEPTAEDHAWAVLRAGVETTSGAWYLPELLQGKEVAFSLSDAKVKVVLRFGEGLTLSVDCSDGKARRRWRTIQSIMPELPRRLPDFRLILEGEKTATLVAEFSYGQVQEVGGVAASLWFNGCLADLSNTFAGRRPGALPDPERERRDAETASTRRERMGTVREAKYHDRNRSERTGQFTAAQNSRPSR